MTAWDLDPNLYASPYRALAERARALLRRESVDAARTSPSAMIAREWRGTVRTPDADAYLAYLERTGLADYASTPGHRGTMVLRTPVPDGVEFTLITLWESAEAVRRFAGDDPLRARYYPEDGRFLSAAPERVRHYEVAAAPGIG